MDNRVKILSDLRERLDNRGKNGAEGQQEIQEIFRSFLSDSADGGKKQSSHETKVVAILELLIKSAKTYPDSFLGVENTGKQESYFCIWIVHRLILFLANPSQSSLHQKSIEAIYALTMLLKYKQQKLCMLLVNILVPLLKDLHMLVKNSLGKKTVDMNGFPATLQNFQIGNVGSQVTDNANISVKNENEALALLRNLGEVIYCILPDICQAFPKHYISLWKLFCTQSLWNDIAIKEVSLRCVGCLLKWRPVPLEMVGVDSFLVIVTCLKEIISQQKIEQPWTKTKQDDIQATLSSVITCSLKSPHHRKRIPNTCFDLLVNTICQLSANFACLTNNKLKLAIAEMISTMCEQVQCDGFIATSNENFQICAKQLVMLIGCHDDFQHMVKCFHHFIVCDFLAKRSQNSCPKKPRIQETAKVMELKTGTEKRRLVDSEDDDVLKFLSTRFYFLWENATNNDLTKDVNQALDGLLVILRSYMMVLGCSTLFNDELSIIKHEMVAFCADTVTGLMKICESLTNKKIDPDLIKLVLCKIYQIIKSLLFYGFQQILPPELLTSLISIVSLPWLVVITDYNGDIPCLPEWNMTRMRHLAGAITSLVNMTDYYELLTLFPVDTWSRWRIHVFQLSLVKNVGNIQSAVINCLPMLVASTRENEHYEILDILKHAQKDAIQVPLSKVFGDLACALDSCVDLKEMTNFDDYPLKLRPFCCQFCQQSHNKGKPLKHAAFVREAMTLLLSRATAKTKLTFVVSFKQLSRHYDVPAEYCSYVVNECIELIEDPDYDIRVKFSKLLPCLTQEDVDITKTIVSKVKEVFTKVSAKKKTRLQETVVYSIGELGKDAQDDLLLVVIISLLETFLSDTKVISSIAFTQILAVAKYKRKTTQEMFGDLKFHICKFMVEKAISEHDIATEDPEACLNVFGKVSRVFNFKSVKVLLQSTQSIIVPQLVKKATVQASFVLRQLAKYLKVNYRKDLLLLNFNFIFSHLVRTCSGAELKEALAFVQRETDVDLGSLLKSDSQSVVNQLLLHLYSSYNKVFTGLTILASKDDSRVGDKDITSPEQMAEFLHPRLLGILAFFNTVLLDDKNIEEKYRALGSLVKLMEMMGPKHITVVRVKVMAILKIALHFDRADFRELCCGAWDCFVRCLDVTSLRSMLGHIVVTLTPLLAHCVNKVSRILHYLIVEKEEELRGSFKDIYFIPDYPELNQVNGVLRKSTREGAGSNLRVEVEQILKGVAHESQDVRHHAVTRLKGFLHEHQNEMQEFITNKDEVDPVVTSLINKLIERCSEPVHSTQVKIGECLGELGAIDPGWLDKPRQNFNEDTAIYEMKCDSPAFAVDLLNELVRAFLAAAHTRSQDCSAYAIQEVLQIYECSNQTPTSSGYKIWCELPEHIQEVLKPHLHSKYVHSAQANRSKLSRPIYFSNNGKNFADWISTWSLDLVSKVHQRKPLRLFKACSAVFKHDINTAIFLLPHIILYVAIDGNSTHHTEVYNEILAILKHVEERHDRTGIVYPQGVTDFSHISAQTIFSILDYLTRWARLKADSNCKTQILASRSDKNNSCAGGNGSDDGLQKVLQFLEGIPQNTLATASFHCKAYARSLMHFEQFIEKSQQDLQVHLNLIQQLYWALNEPDGVVGVAAVRKCPASLYEETLEHESAGKLRDAVACYERAIQLEPDRIENHKRLMSCWIVLGQVSTALEHANGVLTRRPGWTNSINSYRIEACWRLGQWDELESYAKLEGCCTDWSTGVGKILLAVKKKDKDSFSKCIFELRNAQMEPLSAASMESGSYQRGYDFIVRLHILHELEDSLSRVFVKESSDYPSVDTMLLNWTKRLAITRASFQAREPILSLRRVMLKLLSNDTSATNVENHCWLQSAKVARKAGHFQTAYSYLLNVSSLCNTTDCCLEQAKLLWSQGNCHQALLRLEKWLAEATPVTDEKSKLTKSKEVVSLNEKWENAHFYLAKYYDKIMNSFADTKKTGTLDFLPFVMKHYGDSLQFGNKFIYQSVPKILQFWLDFGANVPDQGKHGKSDRSAMQQRLTTLNDIMSDLTDRLAPFQFFTAFSQLISRMCHRNEEVWERLMTLISKLLVTYPQQGIWSMVAVSKSTFALRKTRCQKIFQSARRADRKLGRFIEDACKLAQLLIEVSEKNRGKETVLSMTQDFGVLKRLVGDDQFSSIIIPLQSSLTVALPSGRGEHQDHYPFPDSQPTFVGFEDKVEVLQSLARPKKIIARGSDGQSYILLCKPKDDLRKDSRTMEFNGLVNKCLRKDPECRRRQLHIRTYAVVPLNEECGLLEWVPNTCGLRNILSKMYKEKGLYVRSSELKRLYERMGACKDSKERENVFNTQVLKRFPPIFHEWFLKTFSTPTSWYNSRLAYCRTAAVMSMVGHILGLGDRHGENILFDSTNGDCVHVDFNCLFNKGETFECPECVPFRLTHNMVRAMGPLGYEGIFRQSCEVTLKLMRSQHDSLLSVLKTFVYDPLVEWGVRRQTDTAGTSAAKEEGLKIVKQIDKRLLGYSAKNKIQMPLSIEGEVFQLITDATDVDNLSRMYIGWAAHL